jgi:hypothetical protein
LQDGRVGDAFLVDLRPVDGAGLNLVDRLAARDGAEVEEARRVRGRRRGAAAVGTLVFASAQPQRAQRAFERVVEIDPTGDYARFALGRTLERQGAVDRSIAQYRIAVGLSSREEYVERLNAVAASAAVAATDAA